MSAYGSYVARVRNPSGLTVAAQREPAYSEVTDKGKGSGRRKPQARDAKMDNMSGYVRHNLASISKPRGPEHR